MHIIQICITNPVSWINSQIHSVSLASRISTHLIIHLSAHLCHHHHSHHPLLLHFRLKTIPGMSFSTNPSYLNTSYLDCLHDHCTGPMDRRRLRGGDGSDRPRSQNSAGATPPWSLGRSPPWIKFTGAMPAMMKNVYLLSNAKWI